MKKNLCFAFGLFALAALLVVNHREKAPVIETPQVTASEAAPVVDQTVSTNATEVAKVDDSDAAPETEAVLNQFGLSAKYVVPIRMTSKGR
jgi:hypothetical protein